MADFRPIFLDREQYAAHIYMLAAQVFCVTKERKPAYMAQLMAVAVRNFKMTATDFQQQYPVQCLYYTEYKENFAQIEPRLKLPDKDRQLMQRLTAGWFVNNNQRDYIEPRKVPLRELAIGAPVARNDDLLKTIDLIRNVSQCDIDYLGLEARGDVAPNARKGLRRVARNPNEAYRLPTL